VAEEDLAELHRLDREVFRKHAYPYFVLRQFYDLYQDELFVLDDDGDFRGYVLAGTGADRRRSWILGLGIDHRWRRQGLGRRLMGEVLERLRARGVREVRLGVEPANRTAIDLYTSLGFVRVERRADYFGAGADRLLMTLTLVEPDTP